MNARVATESVGTAALPCPTNARVGTAALACPTNACVGTGLCPVQRGSQTRVSAILCTLCVLVAMLGLSLTSLAASPPQVQFDTSHIGPRQMEDITGRHIPRDWGRAWQTLAMAFEQNRPDLLSHYFTGFAQQKLVAAIAAQEKSGLRTQYIDHGHKLAAYFYSPDGGAIELHDTADLEIQVFDGNQLVHSERVTLHYIGLMTPAADHWEVRLLEAVPNF